MRLLFTLLIIAGIIAALYYAVMTAIAKVSLEISFKGIDLGSISLDNILTGTSTAKVQINAKLVNRNNFDIYLSNFHIWIYYNGTLMAQSADTQNSLSKVVMPTMGTIEVTHDVTIYLNNTTLQVLKDLKNGVNTRFDYTSQFKVFGFPYTYKDYFNYKF